MSSSSRSLKLLLMTTVLAGCGNGASGQATSAAARPGGSQSYCPSVKDVSTAAGFPVILRVAGGSQDSFDCVYELTGRYRGTTIELTGNPASLAEDVFTKVKKSAKAMNGTNAEAERIDVGSGGWAYGGGGSEAAATGAGHVYHVALHSGPLSSIGDQKDALVRILKVAVQSAPAGEAGRGQNVCTLATSAEFDEAYEIEPAMRGMSSDPMATNMSWGPHCDYDGGSIDLVRPTELDRLLGLLKADKQPRQPVPGLGQRAFFTIVNPDDENSRRGFLAVYDGPRIVAFSMMSHGHEAPAATRPRLERFAKLVLPRVK
jgi:hypothetical protein